VGTRAKEKANLKSAAIPPNIPAPIILSMPPLSFITPEFSRRVSGRLE